jgi:phage terminase large subunit-like protein
MELVFQDKGQAISQQWFHREWQQAMTDFPRVMIIAPRDHGKTTQVPVGRALWELGRDPNLRIKIVCQSDGKAMERLFEIATHIEQNKTLHEIFPNLAPAERGSWTKHKLVVSRDRISKDASIEAVGITSTATGGRADILIADDVVDRRNALQYPALREMIKHAWKSDWTQLLEPEGKIWYICTLWHNSDLSHELKRNAAFKVIEHSIGPNFEPIWPSKWGEKELRARALEIGTVEFDRSFRNIALSGEIATVDPKWIRYYEGSAPPLSELVRITGVDLRGAEEAKRGKEDYFGKVTFGYHRAENRIYVLDAWKGRPSFEGQMDKVRESWKVWKELMIGIESANFQDALRRVLVASDHLPLVPVRPENLSKEARLTGVTPYIESGMVVFPARFNPEHPDYDGERADLIPQLLEFPLGRWRDLVDAFVYGLRLLFDQVIVPEAGEGDDGGSEVGITVI